MSKMERQAGLDSHSSSIGQNLMTNGHRLKEAEVFTIILRARTIRPLQFIYAVVIQNMEPVLCRPNELFVLLSLLP